MKTIEGDISNLVDQILTERQIRPPQSTAALTAAIGKCVEMGHPLSAIKQAAITARMWSVNGLVSQLPTAQEPSRPRQPVFTADDDNRPRCTPEQQAAGLAAARAALKGCK